MKIKHCVTYVIILLLSSSFCFSQNAITLDTYEKKSMFMMGNNGFVINNQYKKGHAELLHVFHISPQGLDLYLRSRRNRTIGLTISLLGTAGTLYSLANKNSKNTFFWVSLASTAVAVPFNMKANNQLNQAVWIRNRDIFVDVNKED